MINEPLISIIIPVYNAEDYLVECLKSIQRQTYTNIEIIIINDGSTDESARICDEFAKKDPKIKVKHQNNMGVVLARKNALLYAKGFYTCFVDADDKIDSKMIEFFMKNIGEADLITSACYQEDISGKYNIRTDALEEKTYNSEEDIKYFISNMIIYKERFEDGILPYLWNKMFKTELLNEVIGEVDNTISYSEDRDLLFRYILRSKSIRITHECFYFYRYRLGSATHMTNMNYMSDLNKLYLSLKKVFDEHILKQSLMHQLQLFIISHIYAVPWYMGFEPDVQMIKYIFPFPELMKEDAIILYGAGNVGMEYYRQIYRKNLAKLVLWVDKKWKIYENNYTLVSPPEDIKGYKYDYIVIAVKKKELADEIRKELVQNGIEEEKILWKMPIIAFF